MQSPGDVSPERKLACVLRLLHGDVTVAEAATAVGAPEMSVVAWRQAVLKAGLAALDASPLPPPQDDLLVRISTLLGSEASGANPAP